MTVEEAARTVGIKEESVRKRVRRGNMRFEKAEDGRHCAYVEGMEMTGNGYARKSADLYADRSVDETGRVVRELIATKDKSIGTLQDQVQEERETRRCADKIIAQPTEANAALPPRVPELDVVRAVANAKLCAGDGLETLWLVNGGSGG